jgi:hypothetical protein
LSGKPPAPEWQPKSRLERWQKCALHTRLGFLESDNPIATVESKKADAASTS